MKSKFQVLTFLNQYCSNSDFDNDMITAFLEKRYRITPATSIFASESPLLPLDVKLFTSWYESGYTASEIAKIENTLVILGSCTTTEAIIVGKLEGEAIIPISQQISTSLLTKATGNEIKYFQHALFSSNLQFNPRKLALEVKYIPKPNDKVFFHPFDFATTGVGIVRSIDKDTKAVEFYCYFIYPTKLEQSKLGSSMHERDIANLYENIFEPLLEPAEKRFTPEDGISAYRRLKNELEKTGKVWKDKISRIEPPQVKLAKNATYWYISDKLRVVQEVEKDTPTTQMRYLCGNYFVKRKAAEIMLEKIKELICSYLASPQWPNID